VLKMNSDIFSAVNLHNLLKITNKFDPWYNLCSIIVSEPKIKEETDQPVLRSGGKRKAGKLK
jgi:hypothetical protein